MKTEEYEEIKRQIQIYFRNEVPKEIEDDALADIVEEQVLERTKDMYLSIDEKVELSRQIFSSIRGLGVLDSILYDDDVTEIMINGYDNIFIEKSGRIQKLDKHFESEEELRSVIERINRDVGRTVNEANPILDTRLKDGSRVNVVLPPISLKGSIVTIRKFSKEPMTIERLIRYGSITPDIAQVLETLVKARYNIFICGGTGSGKTTFLNAVSNFIPKDERVITIEDSAELQIEGIDNLVSMETRNKGVSGNSEINITQLIKASLRMRPDRIVVGEVRGAEALDMLQAMNTGHDGSLSTGHANSAKDMLSRLETMVIQGSEGLPLAAVRQQIASALDIIVYLSRLRDHSRKTMEITEVLDVKDGAIQLNPLYKFVEDESSTMEKVHGSLIRTKNKLVNSHKLELSGYKLNALTEGI